MSSGGHKSSKPHKSAKPIVRGDVVLLSHKRIGVVRYVGEISEYVEKGIWYGIEIRMTQGVLGDTNGTIGTTQYFRCPNNEGLFVKLQHIVRRIEPKELLEKVVKLTKSKSTLHSLLNQSNSELSKLKKKFHIGGNGRGKRRAHSKPTLDNTFSGSRSQTYTADDPIMEVSISDAPHSSLEFSVSHDYSVTGDAATKHGTKSANHLDLSDAEDEYTLPGEPVSDAEVLPPTLTPKWTIQQRSAPVLCAAMVAVPSLANTQKTISSSNKSVLQTAFAIQVASPLKTNHNHTRLTRSETQPTPQLMVAIHNELSPSDFVAKNTEIGSWSTRKVIEWIKSFAGRTLSEEWKTVIRNLQRLQITGADLLSMDETDLLTEQLRIVSPEIRYKIMSQLAVHYKRTPQGPTKLLPALKTSSSSISAEDFEDAKASPPIGGTNSNSKSSSQSPSRKRTRPHAETQSNGKPPFSGYHRLSLSSSRSGNKHSKKNHESSTTTTTTTDEQNRFTELHKLFDEIDRTATGRFDVSAFRSMLIELNTEWEPYKLSNDSIQQCFDEFDLTKTGFVTSAEFVVVMGKTYLRGLHKCTRKGVSLSHGDVTKYFIQLIRHFMKKNATSHKPLAPLLRRRSESPSQSTSKPPPPPPVRKHSRSRAQSKPQPPPKRDLSPSQRASYKCNTHAITK